MQDEVIKVDQDNSQQPEQTPGNNPSDPATHDGPEVNRKRRWRALFGKRWTFPALYLTAAVLIIGLMYFQANRGAPAPGKTPAAGAKPAAGQTVSTSAENFIWPVAPGAKNVQLLRGYYDRAAKGATVSTLAKDLVHFGNSYTGSAGYDLGAPQHQAFQVVASAPGVVEDVRGSRVMGRTVEVNDGGGYTTVYQSLGGVDVQQGEKIAQGQVIGTSGTNAMEANLGNHLFFEIEKNGLSVDPGLLLPKTQI